MRILPLLLTVSMLSHCQVEGNSGIATSVLIPGHPVTAKMKDLFVKELDNKPMVCRQKNSKSPVILTFQFHSTTQNMVQATLKGEKGKIIAMIKDIQQYGPYWDQRNQQALIVLDTGYQDKFRFRIELETPRTHHADDLLSLADSSLKTYLWGENELRVYLCELGE